MPRRQAIDIALEATKRAEVLSLLPLSPLPEGVRVLLHIVAEGEWRDASTERAYSRHNSEEVRAAAANFLTTVLFDRRADPYRVLGLPPKASAEEVRYNKRLLLKWLHPDRNPRRQEQECLARVLEAAETIEAGWTALRPLKADAPRAATPQPHAPARAVPLLVRKASGAPTLHALRGEARHAVARGLQRFVRVTRAMAMAAIVALVSLVAWRYAMHEPIGVSLARYSKLALAAMPW